MAGVKIPFWKKWFSYIIEYELEFIESEHGHDLSLCLSDGRFQLNTERAIYSWEDKYDNFYKAFQQMNWDLITGKEVLSLGFGLGSIMQMLEQKFKKDLYFTGVEIDENIIYLAEKYVLHQLKSPIQLIQASAQNFLGSTEEEFDIITIDIFIKDKIPTDILSPQFLKLAKARLTDQGVVMMNHLSATELDVEEAETFFSTVFRKVFPDAKILDVDGNYIFFSRDCLKATSKE